MNTKDLIEAAKFQVSVKPQDEFMAEVAERLETLYYANLKLSTDYDAACDELKKWQKSQPIVCPMCHRGCFSNDKFCPHCGTPLRNEVDKSLKKYYFTYGTDPEYPFRGGWTLIYAPDINSAAQIFKANHPNERDSSILNCADYYTAKEFEKSESYKTGNFGAYCHEIIRPYTVINHIEQGRSEFDD